MFWFNKIKIQKNKKLDLYSFLINLTKEKQFALDFLKIPEGLTERAHILKGLPLGEYEDEVRNQIWREINILFNELWKEHSPEIEKNILLLKETKKYHKWLWEEIPKATGVKWPYRKVFIYPSILSWAGTRGNLIRMGITPEHFINKDFLSTLIHELIHVNLNEIAIGGLKYPKDSEEIADTLIVLKLIRKLKNDFGVYIRPLVIPAPFRKYDQDIKYLKSFLKGSNSFSFIVEKVDKFLEEKNHKEIYKT